MHDDLWDLSELSESVAGRILPLLLKHAIPEVRGGALYGLIKLGAVRQHLRAFRAACEHAAPAVRDGGVWGLSQSPYKRDEKVLWRVMWNDPVSEIQFSAAYSLRVMPRDIDIDRYRKAVWRHPL